MGQRQQLKEPLTLNQTQTKMEGKIIRTKKQQSGSLPKELAFKKIKYLFLNGPNLLLGSLLAFPIISL